MGGFISVNSVREEEYMLKLLKDEFGSKMVLPRRFKPTKTFEEYAAGGIYGVIDAIVDKEANEAMYELALPDHYIGFLRFLIDKEICKKPVICE
jgi:hypothetical protein